MSPLKPELQNHIDALKAAVSTRDAALMKNLLADKKSKLLMLKLDITGLTQAIYGENATQVQMTSLYAHAYLAQTRLTEKQQTAITTVLKTLDAALHNHSADASLQATQVIAAIEPTQAIKRSSYSPTQFMGHAAPDPFHTIPPALGGAQVRKPTSMPSNRV